MEIANNFEKKKCHILKNHVCPLKPDMSRMNTPCMGCDLHDKWCFYLAMSENIEEKIGK